VGGFESPLQGFESPLDTVLSDIWIIILEIAYGSGKRFGLQ